MQRFPLSQKGIVISLLWLIFPAGGRENAIFWWKSGLGELKIGKMGHREDLIFFFFLATQKCGKSIFQKVQNFHFFLRISLIFAYFSSFLSPKSLSFIKIVILCCRSKMRRARTPNTPRFLYICCRLAHQPIVSYMFQQRKSVYFSRTQI